MAVDEWVLRARVSFAARESTAPVPWPLVSACDMRQAQRNKAVEEVCGKYQESADFVHDKAEEKRLEERPWRP